MVWLTFALLFGLVGPGIAVATAQDEAVPETIEAFPDAPHYTVAIVGVDADSGLGRLLHEVSELVRLQKTPPSSLAGLDRRASNDIESFAIALRSEGFYGYTVRYDIDDNVDPVAVTVTVDPGPVYELESYEVIFTGSQPPPPSDTAELARLGIRIGMRAQAPFITGAQTRLMTNLADNGRPLAVVEDSKIIVDHATNTMRVTLTVDPGPPARFGSVQYDGLTDVQQAYLERLIPWTAGASYDQRLVNDYRRRVTETELFESVVIDHAPALAADGTLPMTVGLVESRHRTIGGGLTWSTDIGPGVSIFWVHRNSFGQGESTRIELDASKPLQRLNALLRIPAFRRIDQALVFQATALHQNDDAFNQRSLRFYGGMEWFQTRTWTLTAGGETEVTDIREAPSGNGDFFIVGVPFGARYDGTDDLLDPSRGSRFSTLIGPTLVTGSSTLVYLGTDTAASTYYMPFDSDRLILAVRGRVGSILGAGPDSLPASRRFYAGGGGSIRGFESRSVGPVAPNGDPLGGTSVWEASFEARIRISDSFGVVPFIDLGQVGRDPWPPFGEMPRIGAGLGFRYYTGIGPIRLDVAVPVNPRRTDNRFEIYLSIGQAF
jgi:translocation and assembly module TamA